VAYDYLLTVEQELQYVWSARWSSGKLLFILVRYIVFIDIPLFTWDYFASVQPSTICRVPFDIAMGFEALGVLSAWLVVGLRTWAIWNKNRVCGVVIILAFSAALGLGLYDVILFATYQSRTETTLLSLQQASGCGMATLLTAGGEARLLFEFYVVSAMYEGVILFATLLRGVYHWRRSNRSSLIATLYRDALLASVIAFSKINGLCAQLSRDLLQARYLCHGCG